MKRTAHLSDDGLYRFLLGRIWDEARPTLTFIMLNPSTADAMEDDPTIRRCVGFARDLGHGGIRVLNLYAYRATKPVDLWKADDPTGGAQNDALLRGALLAGAAEGQPVIAAWGANAKADRVDWLTSQLGSWCLHALHTTKGGAPGHPLYLPATARPEPWMAAA